MPITAARELALMMALGQVRLLCVTIMCVRRLTPIRRMTLALGGMIPNLLNVFRF